MTGKIAILEWGTALLGLATIAQPGLARAEDDAGASDTIVVSALRTPVEADRVSSTVTVIDQQALDRLQPLALSDVLATVAGITVARTGGFGQVTSLRIRGADPSQSVVVIDGMRMSDPTATNGGFDFTQLYADDIARIEVLRGPQSMLWGSDAIGGVINLTTLAPTHPREGDLAVEAGSHQTVSAHAGLGGTSALVDWRVAGSTFTTEGIPTLAGGTVPNGYTRQAASATTTWHLAPDISLDLRGFWDSGRNGFSDTFSQPGSIYPGDYAQTSQWAAYAGLNVVLADGRFKNRLAVTQDQTDNRDFYPLQTPALAFVGHGRTRRYEYQGTVTPAKDIDLVFGAEREEQHMRVGSPYDAVQPYELFPLSATTDSVYGEARVSPLAGLTLNGGLRYDHHSQFGGNTVFSAGAVYTPDRGTTVLRATYDEGYKAPSLYQLYSDYGNATLRPERAHGWEAGMQRALFAKAVQLGATWWDRQTTNLIGFAYCPTVLTPTTPPACAINFYGYYANIDRAAGHGLELTGAAHLARLTAEANYSVVVHVDRTLGAPTYGEQLPRVPRHQINASLRYDLPSGVTTAVSVRRSGASADGAAPVTLAGYTLVDWRSEWALRGGLTLYGRVENIGNARYQTAYGYNALGRTATLGLRARF
jgi:vitamin B12 transporter